MNPFMRSSNSKCCFVVTKKSSAYDPLRVIYYANANRVLEETQTLT